MQYNGKMSHQTRDKNIAAFGEENSKIQIMIASLKCGGVGRESINRNEQNILDTDKA